MGIAMQPRAVTRSNSRVRMNPSAAPRGSETYVGRSLTCARKGDGASGRLKLPSLQPATAVPHGACHSGEASPSGPCLLHKAFHGEFDPGSGRTLAACLTHASRAERPLRGYSSGERGSNTWTTYLSHRNTPGKPGSMPDNVQLRRALYQR